MAASVVADAPGGDAEGESMMGRENAWCLLALLLRIE